MDCSNLNFLALPDEVRKHAEKSLKSFSGSEKLIFNQNIFDAIGKLRDENQLYGIRIDDDENDVYFLADDDFWIGLLNNHYVPSFARGYNKAKEDLAALKSEKDEQAYVAFSGVYRVNENFKMPVKEIDGHQVVLASSMDGFGFETGKFIGYWDFIFSNPEPLESLFQRKSTQPLIAKGIQFYGTKMDFVELMVALKENGNLKATYKEVFDVCGKFFGVEIKYRDKYILDLKNNRNAGQEAKLLSQLITALNNRVAK
jgi:hypothetical protein